MDARSTIIDPNQIIRLPTGFKEEDVAITLYRDKAGWCPYCQKVWLHLELKNIPFKMDRVAMRSYGDKPAEFLAKVPSGLLPAFSILTPTGPQTLTESSRLMEVVEIAYPPSSGFVDMDASSHPDYPRLARLERTIFSLWCTLIFRPPPSRSVFGIPTSTTDGRLKDFMSGLREVSKALSSSSTPFFLSSPHPTTLDLLYVSHFERMLPSVFYWCGVDIWSEPGLEDLDAWYGKFEEMGAYLGTKGDYYSSILDIPPQYGPGYDLVDGLEETQRKLVGKARGWGWFLSSEGEIEVSDDCPERVGGLGMQGFNVEEWANMTRERKGVVERQYASMKLHANGGAIARFCARAGKGGANNPRKQFGAKLADPYAESDEDLVVPCGRVLEVLAHVMSVEDEGRHLDSLEEGRGMIEKLAYSADVKKEIAKGMNYLRDRVGVPRDMPLVAARQLRAHLAWVIEELQ
ncbi:hypothetical protein TrRE_jg3911 [Triparma retinervis]|uniref:GST N-terminal domain-containing protein n=1 Tax=Triparma retinervis TaxID=2557542 RepID=A0A9W7A0V5_9STRA|nr:hypothetical protein TrRE_jg3911 [Triparma retinervis]